MGNLKIGKWKLLAHSVHSATAVESPLLGGKADID